ncbi:MAG: LPS translocon maturation chaperone LptM [Candidatus Saccharicenans sp.]
MKKILLIVLGGALILASSGCGRKGPLQAPVPRVPQEIKDFKVDQRREDLIFSWTNPLSYLDGQPLEIASTEILALEKSDCESAKKIREEEFLKMAKPLSLMGIGNLELKRGQAVLKLENDKVLGKCLILALRVRGKKGGWSKISNQVTIVPRLVASPPENLKAEVEEDKISLSWQPSRYSYDRKTEIKVKGYNIYRSSAGDFQKINEKLVEKTTFEDRNFNFGQTYRYFVRAVTGEGGDLRESADSEIAEITAKDVFPPKKPAEVQDLVTENGVRLTWLPNSEKDLAGYRIYRRKEGEQKQLLTPELISIPFFLDAGVEKKVSYVYSIVAVDKSGNESYPEEIRVKT